MQKLDARCSQFPDRYAVLLQWWPFAPRRAYPYFAAVPCSTTVWEEQQEFWPLLRRVEAPFSRQSQQHGAYCEHSGAAQQRILQHP